MSYLIQAALGHMFAEHLRLQQQQALAEDQAAQASAWGQWAKSRNDNVIDVEARDITNIKAIAKE